MDKAFTDNTGELAAAAQVNFQNVARMQPGLPKNPVFIIAMAQLDELVNRLFEREESGKSQPIPCPPDHVPK